MVPTGGRFWPCSPFCRAGCPRGLFRSRRNRFRERSGHLRAIRCVTTAFALHQARFGCESARGSSRHACPVDGSRSASGRWAVGRAGSLAQPARASTSGEGRHREISSRQHGGVAIHGARREAGAVVHGLRQVAEGRIRAAPRRTSSPRATPRMRSGPPIKNL